MKFRLFLAADQIETDEEKEKLEELGFKFQQTSEGSYKKWQCILAPDKALEIETIEGLKEFINDFGGISIEKEGDKYNLEIHSYYKD